MQNDNHVIATFGSRTLADDAVEALHAAGISREQLSLLVSEGGGDHHFSISRDKTKTAEGVGYGTVLGGLVGALMAMSLPGSIFVAGPFAAALASSASGAVVGGLAGGLIGMGIAEDEIKLVEEELGSGDIVIGVHRLDEQGRKRVKELLERSTAKRVH